MHKVTLQRYFSFPRILKCAGIVLLLHGNKAFSQTDTVKALQEVNVRSTTIPQLQVAIPSQVVSASQFLQYNAFNVADAIRNFAGVNVRDYGGIGGLKTVSVRSLGANHTIVLYDGVQINDAQNGQIDLSKFNLYNLSEVSLYIPHTPDLCMPARAYSGASVLNVKTVQPKLSADKPFKILAGVKGGSFGLFNPYLQWQQRINKRWSFIINTYKQEANGEYDFTSTNYGRDTSGTRLNGDINARQIDGALYWAKSDSNRFRIQFNYYNIKRGLPGAVITDAQYLNQRLQNRDAFIQAGYEKIWANSLHLLLNTKVADNYQHYTDKDFLNSTGGLNDSYTQKEFYQSAALSYKPLKSLEVSYSGDVAVTDLNSNAFLYAFPTRLSLLNNIAAKFETGRFTLQGNLLNTYINDGVRVGNAPPSRSVFSPAVIATFKPFVKQNLQLRAFYKDIFRYPTLSDQYYYTPQPRLVDPEYVKQYNIGAAYIKYFDKLVNHIILSADVYYNDVTNKIIYLPGRSAEIPSVRNLGTVDIRGVDITAKTLLKPSYNWSINISGAYTFQKAVDATNRNDRYYLEQIPYTPVHNANFNTSLTYKKIGLNYNFSYSSSRYYTSNNTPQYYIAPYKLSDVSAVYNFEAFKMPVMASAEVNNLFSERYEVVRYFPMPPRSVRFTLQITI